MLKRVWAWLRSLFVSEAPGDVYLPQEREIYKIFDGKELRCWDPLVLYKRLRQRGGDISTDIRVASLPMKKSAEAHDSLIRNIRWVFEVKPFEEGGLSEIECLELLTHFWEYISTIKKNSRTWQTSAEETSPTTPSPTAEEENPPTKPSSDSGSDDDEPPTGPLSPSPSGPASPSGPSNPGLNTSSP